MNRKLAMVALWLIATCIAAANSILVSNATLNGTIYIHIPGNNGTSIAIQNPAGETITLYSNKSTAEIIANASGIWKITALNDTYYSFVPSGKTGRPAADLAGYLPHVTAVIGLMLAIALAAFVHALIDAPAFAKEVREDGTAIKLKNSGEPLTNLAIMDGGFAFRRDKVAPYETIALTHAGTCRAPARLECFRNGKRICIGSETRMRAGKKKQSCPL